MTMTESKRDFRSIQQEYDRLFTQDQVRDEARGYRWHAATLKKYAPAARSILDVACGGGYFFREARTVFGPEVALTGIDISPEALRIARGECATAQYVLSVGEALPFRENSFDAITCLGSLEHFLDIPAAVKEMMPLVRPGGLFYILVPNLFWYKDVWAVMWSGEKKDRNQTQERFCSRGEWTQILESTGLKVTAVEKYNGIARYGWKQQLKDWFVPLNLSYHFVFICQV